MPENSKKPTSQNDSQQEESMPENSMEPNTPENSTKPSNSQQEEPQLGNLTHEWSSGTIGSNIPNGN
jgi:hypothetical protein